MLTKLRNRVENTEQGFTLIELLVVILIIGILAAIAIPSFLNQRVKGQDACAKSMSRTMQTAIETYYTDNDSYAATIGSLASIENQVTGTAPCGGSSTAIVGTAADCTAGTGAATNYCVRTTSVSGTSFDVIRAATGAITRACSAAGTGGCKSVSGQGRW